jgi:ADP-ribose pyrophosphatase
MTKPVFVPAEIGTIADRDVPVAVSPPMSVGDGFRPYDRFHVTLEGAGGEALHQRRDIIRVGPVVGVLAYDPSARLFVLIRQFRLAAHLATGKGEVVEIAAGLIEKGELAEDAALRECREEIGATPQALLPMLSFMPSPGVSDEFATLFLALVDSTQVPHESGEAGETEFTRPLLVPFGDAMAALASSFPGVVGNGFVLIALQWFALNQEKVEAFIRAQN